MGDSLCRHDVDYGRFRFDKFNDPCEAEVWTNAWRDGLYKRQFLPTGGAGNLGIRRWVHEAIGGFDEDLPRFADSDYYWRLQVEGFELHHVPEAIVQVRMGRVNPSLPYLFRRGRTAAAANYWNYKSYRDLGMPPPTPLKKSLATWFYILRRAVRAGRQSRHKRVSWLREFTQQTGDLVGQFQGRITNPCKPYHLHKKGQITRKRFRGELR